MLYISIFGVNLESILITLLLMSPYNGKFEEKTLTSFSANIFSYLNVSIIGIEINTLPFFSCLLASIFVCILIKVNKIDRWHGPADTIYAAHQKAGTLDIQKGFSSTLASFFSISGGASVGMYGPLVHFGGTLAAYLLSLIHI